MTTASLIALALTLPPAAIAQTKEQAQATLAHVSNSFYFVIHAPLTRTAPLFGPDGERVWAGKHWNPEFLYPQPAKDIEGAAFTIEHGPHKAVWVNTLFDLPGGRMQYVYVIPDALVTTIDVKLTSIDASTTRVDVTYVRTALEASANDDVRAMGDSDRANGPHWQEAIETYLKTAAK